MTITVPSTAEVITEFFHRFGAGDRAAAAALFAADSDFCVPGADHVPWTGSRSTVPEIERFLASATEEVETEQFAVELIVADGEHGVAVGQFRHRVKRTGKTFSCRFALHVQVIDGSIRRYHMFEDSHAVAEAFRD